MCHRSQFVQDWSFPCPFLFLSLHPPSTEVQNYIYNRASEGSSLRLAVWENQLHVSSYFQAFVAEMCKVTGGEL